MTRKFFLIFLLVASFCAGTFSQEEEEEEETFLYKDEDCHAVQAFPAGRRFYYTYEGTVIHRGSADEDPTGFRVKCSRVIISALSNCAAKLSVEDCGKYMGQWKRTEGRVTFEENADSDGKLNHQMRRFKTYFYFNKGEISQVYFHQDEPTDIRNMKKAILSALSMKFAGQGIRFPVNETFTVSDSPSIFGVGNMKAKVTFRSSSITNLTTVRDLTRQQLNSDVDSSIFRSALITEETTDLSRFVGHKLSKFLKRYEIGSISNQTCQYMLHRHRRISEVTCHDVYSEPFFDYMVQRNRQVFPHRDVSTEFTRYLTTNVTIHLSSYRIATTKASDGMTEQDQEDFRSYYHPSNTMFEANLEQSLKDQFENFREFKAFSKLIKQPLEESAPIFSKLILWITNQDENAINRFSRKIMSTFSGQPETMPKVMSMWLQLLNECMKPQWCNESVHCTNQHGCQTAFSDFLLTGRINNMPNDVQQQIINLMSSVTNPNSALVQASRKFASHSPSSLLGFGKVLTRHASLASNLKFDDIVQEGVEHLQNILRANCPHVPASREVRENVENAIRSLAMFVNNQDVVNTVMTCMHGHSAPSSILIAALQILNNDHCVALPKVRRKLVSMIEDERQVSEVRLASAFILLKHEPSETEIRPIVQILQSDEHHGLQNILKSYLKTQIQLSGTKHSLLSARSVQHLSTVLSAELGPEGELFTAKSATRTFERERNFSMPLIGQVINGKAKVTFYMLENNPAPYKIDLSIDAEADGQTLSVLNANIDVSKINPVLQTFIGSSGILPQDIVHHLLNTPLDNFFKPLDITPPSLSNFGLRSLEIIRDQFRMAQLMADLENAPIFHLEVMGKPIKLNALMKSASKNDVTIAQLLSFAEKLETGIDFNEHLLFAIGLSHGQIPTSLGLPLITNSELTNHVYPMIKLTVPLKQLYFTGRGEIDFHFHPRFQMCKTVERSMRIPLGGRIGSGALVQIGMDSKLAFKINKSPGHLALTFATLADNSLLSKKVNSLGIPWFTPSGLQITSDLDACRISARYPVFPRLGRSFHYRKCHRSGFTSDLGLRLDTVRRSQTFGFTWGSALSKLNGNFVPSVLLNVTMLHEALNYQVRKSTTVAEYLPLQNTLRITGYVDGEKYYTASADLHRSFDQETNHIESMSSSLNFTSFGQRSTFEANGYFVMKRNLEFSETESQFSNFENLLTLGSDAGFDVAAKFTSTNYPEEVGFVGRFLQPTSTGEFSAAATVYLKDPSQVLPITTWVLKKDFVKINGVKSSKIEGTLNNFTMPFFPYNKLNVSMVWSNDTDLGYFKILRLETTVFGDLSGPFLDFRQATKFTSAEDRSKYDWNATITSPYVQGQFRADARHEDNFTIKSRIIRPSAPLFSSVVQSTNYEEIMVSSEAPNTMYGVDVALGTFPWGHSNTTFFVVSNGVKQYLHLTKNSQSCNQCFDVELSTAHFKSQLGLNIQPHIFSHFLFIDTDRSYVADQLGILAYPLPLMDNEFRTGYSLKAEIDSSDIAMSGEIRSGDMFCKTNGDLIWTPSEEVTQQHYESKLATSCYNDESTESVLDISVGLSYSVGEEQLLKKRRTQFNYSVNAAFINIFESFDINVTSSSHVLQLATITRVGNYSYPDREEPMDLNKHATVSVTFTRQNYTNELWSYPVYKVTALGQIPSLYVPGGYDKLYNHSGFYFLDQVAENENPFVDACGAEQQCTQILEEAMEDSLQDSYDTVMRLFVFVATEHQNYIDAPWNRLSKMTSGAPKQLNLNFLKNLGLQLKAKVTSSFTKGHLSDVLEMFSFDNSLLNMQQYFKMLSEMKSEEEYDLSNPKIYIESLFRYIWEFDFALASVMENPTLLPSQLARFRNHLSYVLAPAQPDGSELYKTFGASYAESTQFVTVNKHLHDLPTVSSDTCSWVGVVDTDDAILTVLFDNNGLNIHFLDESLSQLRNGSFLFTDGEGNSRALEYPFATKKCFCIKLADETVKCFNFFTNMRFSYNTNTDEVFYYVETKGKDISSALKGLCGIPDHNKKVPNRYLPDGSIAENEAEFFNKYELGGSERCQLDEELLQTSPNSDQGASLCSEAFSGFHVFDMNSGEVSSLQEACSMKATSQEDTCKYTNLLVHSLRQRGIPVLSQESCVSCASAEVQLTRVNLLLIVSRSSDMPGNATARTLIAEIFERAYERLNIEGSVDVSVTLLAYGGPLEFYQPAVNTINGKMMSSDITAIQARISGLEFNGPSYDSHSTIEALQFAADHLNVAHKGVFQHIILVAPETETNNVGGKMSFELIGQIDNHVTKLYIVGTVQDPDCNNRFAYIPAPFRGHCFESSDISPLIDEIQEKTSANLNLSAICNCEENPATGILAYHCEPS